METVRQKHKAVREIMEPVFSAAVFNEANVRAAFFQCVPRS